MARKVIITCAVTGSVHTPSMCEFLPVNSSEIAEAAITAAAAGASIVHVHARDPTDGRPTPDPDVFMEFLPRIKAATNAVINITTGGGSNMSVDQRMAAALRAQPEMCSLNMGSMNFGLFHLAGNRERWQHEWEPAYLEATRDFIFKNTFADIERALEVLGKGCGTRFEFECYDLGHLYALASLVERGLVESPLSVQFIFGILGGIGAEPENITAMKSVADRLFGEDYLFSVAAAGRHQMGFATVGAVMGGNVRVGMEDSLYLERGRLARSNAEQVQRIRTVLEALSFEIADPDEARATLALKGADQVAF